MKLIRALQREVVDKDTPAVRHIPALAGMVTALVAIWLTPQQLVEYPGWTWLSVALMIIIEIVAFTVPWGDINPRWTVVIPLAAILALGLFRTGTGGSFSVFGAILVLPLVWATVHGGARLIAATIAAVVIALLMPYLLGTESWDNGQIVRVVFVATVYAGVAIAVSEIARHARQRLAQVAELSQQRAALLVEAENAKDELARSADELRAAEEFTTSIWEALENEAVIVTDLEGTIESWGPGARILLGYATVPDAEAGEKPHPRAIQQLLSSAPAESTPPGDHSEDAFALLIKIGRSPGLGDGELTFADATSEPIAVYLSCSERHAADGTPIGYTFVARDARYAKEITRLKDEFVGTISHELRTPLSSILGYLELVAEESETLTADQQRFLAVAERNAQRLLHLVGDLLFIAQVDGGKIPLDMTTVDLRDIAAASAESIMPVAAAAGVAVRLDQIDVPMRVRVDPRRIGQALDNLVSNAIKFTPPKGTVTISLRKAGDDAVLAVADSGMGIPPEELAQLAERFFRTRMATRQAIQGVGLGLSITKAIVSAHGGTLAAASVVGEGTVFEIRVPAHQD